MKKLLVTLTVVGILALGAGAFAFGPGWFGGGNMMGGTGYSGIMGGGMMGPGMMGGGMMGPGMMGGGMMGGYGMGSGMRGWNTGPDRYGYDQKFLNETRDLRKALNDKRFEYFEALRNPETKPDRIAQLEKDINTLQQKLYEKSPRSTFRGGYGPTGTPCWR